MSDLTRAPQYRLHLIPILFICGLGLWILEGHVSGIYVGHVVCFFDEGSPFIASSDEEEEEDSELDSDGSEEEGSEEEGSEEEGSEEDVEDEEEEEGEESDESEKEEEEEVEKEEEEVTPQKRHVKSPGQQKRGDSQMY